MTKLLVKNKLRHQLSIKYYMYSAGPLGIGRTGYLYYVHLVGICVCCYCYFTIILLREHFLLCVLYFRYAALHHFSLCKHKLIVQLRDKCILGPGSKGFSVNTLKVKKASA